MLNSLYKFAIEIHIQRALAADDCHMAPGIVTHRHTQGMIKCTLSGTLCIVQSLVLVGIQTPGTHRVLGNRTFLIVGNDGLTTATTCQLRYPYPCLNGYGLFGEVAGGLGIGIQTGTIQLHALGKGFGDVIMVHDQLVVTGIRADVPQTNLTLDQSRLDLINHLHILGRIAYQAQSQQNYVIAKVQTQIQRLLLAAGKQIIAATGLRNGGLDALPAIIELTVDDVNTVCRIGPAGIVGLDQNHLRVDRILTVLGILCAKIHTAVDHTGLAGNDVHRQGLDLAALLQNGLLLAICAIGGQFAVGNGKFAAAGLIQIKIRQYSILREIRLIENRLLGFCHSRIGHDLCGQLFCGFSSQYRHCRQYQRQNHNQNQHQRQRFLPICMLFHSLSSYFFRF